MNVYSYDSEIIVGRDILTHYNRYARWPGCGDRDQTIMLSGLSFRFLRQPSPPVTPRATGTPVAPAPVATPER